MAPTTTDPSAALRASILRSWIALERFETKTLDPPDRPGRRARGARKFAVDVGPREPLPWEPGHPACGAPLSNDNVEWRHTLHIGQFDIGDGYERVEAQFPPDTSGRERRPPTRAPAPLLAMTVTTDGRPVMDSLQVSSAAWSIAQTLRIGVDDPAWLHGFDDALSELRGAFERIIIDSAEPPKPIEPLAIVGAPAAQAADDAGVSRTLSLLDDGPPDDHGALKPAAATAQPAPAANGKAAVAGAVGPASDGSVSNGSASNGSADARANAEAEAEPTADADFDDPRSLDAIDDDGIALAPIIWDHLLRLLGAATAILELEGQLVIRPVVRSTTWPESKRVPLGTGDTLLNSFAVEDLERIEWRLQDGQPGAALQRYLGATRIAEEEAEDRIDVDERLDLVREQLDPSKLPSGRWPADPSHDLALGQQLAVNLAMQTTSTAAPGLLGAPRFAPEQSILAVNGPPGTGKTTMLRDLIAALVTERAEVIAGFSSADELFKGEALSVQGDRVVRVSKVSPKLTGREILLACATNAAAQNVSLELPDIGAVHADWRGPGFDAGAAARGSSAAQTAVATPAVGSIAFPGSTGPVKPPTPSFLADFATAALRTGAVADARFTQTGPDARPAPTLYGDDEGTPTDPHELRAWGMIAARLGRRSYCKDFASAVWWGASPWSGGGRSSGGRANKIAPTERAERGLAALLTSTQNADGRAAWEASKARFNEAHAEVERMRRERQGQADALRPADDLEATLAQAEHDLATWTADLEQHEAARAAAADRAAPLVVEQQAAKRRLEAAGPPPPGHTIARLSEAAKTKELARRAAEQEAALAHRYAEEALDAIRALQRKIDQAKAGVDRARFARDEATERLEARAEALAQDAASDAPATSIGDAGSFVVPDDAWESDQSARDLRAPWSDEAWNRARTACFLAALDLHEATILANGRDARRNLGVAIDLISGRISGLTHDVVLAAWQTLFLLVPVVSTTFASLPTMLSGLGQEDLGWLLIDEAGQAQPQQAAGAIWRCQRAVVVGDPHQIEPVSGLPTSLAEAIRERFDVPLECISPEASVQRLADAVMPWGGRRGEDDLWVGVPMNVHRRCEPAIFDLVNAIAYGGRMVNATVPRAPHPALRVETCWLDVPSGSGSDGHWIPAEGHRLDALLAHLGMNGYDFRQVFAVSPFREVAWQLRRRADDPRHRGMTGGTIHTIQGREADTVILVLGGDPTKPGARRWVSSTPNLLNVAASRARQRLYVIGDHDAWIDLPYFRQLGGLRRVAPPAARAGAR